MTIHYRLEEAELMQLHLMQRPNFEYPRIAVMRRLSDLRDIAQKELSMTEARHYRKRTKLCLTQRKDIDEHPIWTCVLLTKSRPTLQNLVRRYDELEIDYTLLYGIYTTSCSAPGHNLRAWRT